MAVVLGLKRLLVLGLSILLMPAQAAEWSLEKNDKKNQIQVYTRMQEQSPLKEFRGEMKVQSTLTGLVALVEDVSAAASWIHNCGGLDIIERKADHNLIIYMITEAPWPVKNRDSIIESVLSQDPKSLTVRIDMSVRNDIFPAADEFVRITNMHGSWTFEPLAEGWVNVTYQVHADPGGGIPNWLINSLVVDAPYYTLKNMREKVREEKYQNPDLVLPHVKNMR